MAVDQAIAKVSVGVGVGVGVSVGVGVDVDVDNVSRKVFMCTQYQAPVTTVRGHVLGWFPLNAIVKWDHPPDSRGRGASIASPACPIAVRLPACQSVREARSVFGW